MQDVKCPIKKYRLPIIIASAIFLAAIISYLAVSLALKNWDKSYLILIGGATLAVIVFGGFLISDYTKQGKFLIPRISIAVSITLVFVLIYLCITILVDVNKAWIMFLIMVIALVGADTVYAYWVSSKTRLVNLLIFILVASALEYTVLVLVELLKWRPYWIIPLVGLLIDVAIVALKYKDIFMKPNKEEKTNTIEENNQVTVKEAAIEDKQDK